MNDNRRSLTRGEFDAVIRRAAELASSDADSGEGSLSEAELFRIAREVGLTEGNVRRALAEVRSGVVGGGSFIDRVFGPSHLHAVRVVPGSPDELVRQLDDFLVATRLLQRVRKGPGFLQYRPAVDWASHLARVASFSSRKYYIASASSVEVRLEPSGPGRTAVELLVEPGTRKENLWGAAIGGSIGGGAVGVGAALGAATVTPLVAAIGAGAVAAGAVFTAVTYVTGTTHKRKLVEVQSELEGLLDTLEAGDSLEPPPSSWRRWVKRHFHGVARDLLREDEAGRR